jgi:hypothetical protein
MKKNHSIFIGGFCLAFFLFAGTCLSAGAQEPVSIAKSTLYYRSIFISKIYAALNGYVVQYRIGDVRPNLGTIYLPLDWFQPASVKAGKAGLEKQVSSIYFLSGKTSAWPHLDVYYNLDKDSKPTFAYVHLYVSKYHGHPTWGMVDPSINLDSEFANAGAPDLDQKPTVFQPGTQPADSGKGEAASQGSSPASNAQ